MIVAVLRDEEGANELVARIDAERVVGVGAPALLEAGLVLSAQVGYSTDRLLLDFVARSDSSVVAFGADHWHEALSAWLRFGKGRHPARLNFGDCMSYAVARVAGEPLLAKGGDFALTDIELA